MVLILLGIAASVVLPVFRTKPKSEDVTSVIERARALAVRRAESLILNVNPLGAWAVRSSTDTSAGVLLSGPTGSAPLQLPSYIIQITPLGACFPQGELNSDAKPWDPARCAPARR